MSDASFGKIIVGYDASEPAQDALRLGGLLADATGAQLTIASVYASPEGLAEAEQHLAHARERLSYGSPARLSVVAGRSAAQGLHELVVDFGADLLVLGASHRGGFALATIGGVADRLIHGAPCAVAVAPRGFRDDPDAGLRVIGVAYDGSPESKEALCVAAAIALKTRGTLRIVGVLEPIPMSAAAGSAFSGYVDPEGLSRDRLHAQLDEAAASVPDELRPQTILASGGHADEEIARRAGVLDLLVIGSRARGPVHRVLLGSVSSGLVHSPPCAVLVVPRGVALPGRNGSQSAPLAATG
jgi:nucleotide-binding universal stress UspA family protein